LSGQHFPASNLRPGESSTRGMTGSRHGSENELACRMVLCYEAAPQKNVGANMAKKAKRREWTKDDVRELKTLARQKTPVAKIAKSLTPMCVAPRKKNLVQPAYRIHLHFDIA
jgi:hypothetical protein